MNTMESILSSCTSGGCGAKIGPGELAGLLADLPVQDSPNLIVGFDGSDDAAVYKTDEENSLISTVDFFSPMVEDPEMFGRIAAANAMSDVWAMGGRPVLALNLVCFPEKMDVAVLGKILKGGAEKIKEAGAFLGGGHSIYDKEIKYGLSVTGMIKTNKILRNDSAVPGHKLILTKPLGVGIVMAAARGGAASELAVSKAVGSMQRLNKYAAEKLENYNVSACTDITGFGLLAHACEMTAEGISIKLFPEELPVIQEAKQYAAEYLLTAAGQRNRNYLKKSVAVEGLDFVTQELLFDPQTSGGLLISVEAEQAEQLLADIQQEDPCAAIIGEIINRQASPVVFD